MNENYDMWNRHAKGVSSWKDISNMLADLHYRMLLTEGKTIEAEAFKEARKASALSHKGE